MNKVIAFDMDDVLVELLDSWVTWLNNHYGTHVECEDVKQWDMQVAFPELDESQIYECLSVKEFWQAVQMSSNGDEIVRKLQNDGYNVIVVTASSPRALHTKLYNCLLVHYPMFTYHDVVVCHNKQLVKCDYIVDDAPHNLEGHDAIKFLMDAPYNRNCPEYIYDFRVHSLDEVYDRIKQLETIS